MVVELYFQTNYNLRSDTITIFESKVIVVKQLTRDVRSIKFSLEGINYKPGQYINLKLDVKNDSQGRSRDFSLSSSPTENFLMITTKITSAPFKQRVASLKIGERVKMSGPFGKFVLKENLNKHHVMLSGGIGITPLRSMLKYATDKKLQLKITLIYSNRTPEEIVFRDNLESFKRSNKNLRIIHTITRPEESKMRWRGRAGRINSRMIKEFVPDLSVAEFYVVGPPNMVDSIVKILRSMKIPDKQINTEHFTGYK